MAKKPATRRSHNPPGTVRLTVNVEPNLRQQARVYAISHGWHDLTSFLQDALRYAIRSKLTKGGTR